MSLVVDAVNKILLLNPKAAILEQDIANRFENSQPKAIVSSATEGLEEALGMLCAVFFELCPSTSATVATIAGNDLFPISAIYTRALGDLLHADSDDLVCVETIARLLLVVVKDLERPRQEVKCELIAAYLLAAALHNTQLGRPLFHSVRYNVVVNDVMYEALREYSSLRDIVDVVRGRFVEQSAGR